MFQYTVIKYFSFKQTKFAYFLTQALGPYIRKMTLDEVGRNQLVRVLNFLYPNEVSKPVSAHSLSYVNRKLPVATQRDLLVDAFKLVQLSRLPSEPGRIDDKWNNVIQGGNCQNLSEAVKNALTISYWSTSIEQGFSLSGRVLSKESASMNE